MKKLLLLCALVAGSAYANPMVKLQTNRGDILLELDEENAPTTVANFLRYVEDNHYDGTIFHRVIEGFMIQGGGFDKQLQEKSTREPIANESHNGLTNNRGSIAMARTSEPHSATSQFFINTVDNNFLNKGERDPYGYAVFGQVIDGMDVVDAIAATPTKRFGRHENVPTQPIEIIDAVIVEPSTETPTTTH